MYCEKCGKKLDDLALFCPKCGAPIRLNQEQLKSASQSFNKKVYLIALLLVATIFVIVWIMGKEKEKAWQRMYDLGQRYLLEEKYEEAVVAFTNAIEIDEKKSSAYIGRGEAYAKSEGTDALILALADYETALSLNDTLADGYLGIADVKIRQKDFDGAMEILQEGAEKAEKSQEIVDKLEEMEAGDIIDSSGNMLLPLQVEDFASPKKQQVAYRLEQEQSGLKVVDTMTLEATGDKVEKITEVFEVDISGFDERQQETLIAAYDELVKSYKSVDGVECTGNVEADAYTMFVAIDVTGDALETLADQSLFELTGVVRSEPSLNAIGIALEAGGYKKVE